MAAEVASFNTSIDSISDWLIKAMLSGLTTIPSTTHSGSFDQNVVIPLTLIVEFDPG